MGHCTHLICEKIYLMTNHISIQPVKYAEKGEFKMYNLINIVYID